MRQSLLRLQKATRHTGSNLPRPRLDYKAIAENVVYKSHNALNRRANLPIGSIQTFEKAYKDRNQLQRLFEAKVHEQSELTKVVRTAKDAAVKAKALDTAKALKREIQQLEADAITADDALFELAWPIPNDTHPSSPLGPEENATLLSTHGSQPVPADPARDHVAIGRHLDLFDFESASTVSGSSFYYLKHEAALLEQALVAYALSVAVKHGFTPVATPDVVRADIAWRCGFVPRDSAASQNYHVRHHEHDEDSGSALVLAGTAEIPLAGSFAGKVLKATDLPAKVVGVGKAYRAEAGAKGVDNRGLYRVHQFTKVELFACTDQDSSEAMMDSFIGVQTEIFEGLGLTFKLLDMPTEELGASAYRKYDIEAWMPGRGSWGEISSTSNCSDYQSRRLHIRYERQVSSEDVEHAQMSGQRKPSALPFAHTLNGTAAAIPRLIVALIENGAILNEHGVAVAIALPRTLKQFWIGTPGRDIIRWS